MCIVLCLLGNIQYGGGLVVSVKGARIPDLGKKFDNITTQICLKTLDSDTHRRKWSIIMNGLDAGELESETKTR